MIDDLLKRTQHEKPKTSYFIPEVQPQYIQTPQKETQVDPLELLVIDKKTPTSDISEIVTNDKLKLLGASASMLKSQINKRSKIREKILKHLDYVIFQSDIYLLQLDHWPMFSDPTVDEKRANLSHSIVKLESEKNQEIVKCFNDQVKLYSELMETLGEYQSHIRRTQLLGGEVK